MCTYDRVSKKTRSCMKTENLRSAHATNMYISHKNTLNAIHRTATHGTLVDALRTRAAHAHMKARNYGVVL